MEKTESPRTTLTLACWMRLYNDLVAGLAHDLAGRASALHSLALVGRRGAPSDDFVLDELEAETEKLASLGEAVRALADGTSAPRTESNDVVLGTLLPRAIEVLRLHHGFEGHELRVDLGTAAPAAQAPADELSRVVLLLAADVASRGTGVIRVVSEDVESTSKITIEFRIADRRAEMDPGVDSESDRGAAQSGNADEVLLNDADAVELNRVIETWGMSLGRTEIGWTVEVPAGGD